MIGVTVKWGTQRVENVPLDTSAKPLEFKHRVAERTGIEPERQRLMTKGVLISDNGTWDGIDISVGQTFMLVASQRRPVSGFADSSCCYRTCQYSSLAALAASARHAAATGLRMLWAIALNFFPCVFAFFYTMFDPRAFEQRERTDSDVAHRPVPQQVEPAQRPRRRVAVPTRCNDQQPLGSREY